MALALKDIRHRYGQVEAVAGATLHVGPGEIVCLFGASGCGKTTLLRLVAGLEPLQSGSIELDGERLAGSGSDFPPERRPVGLVFQEYVLFPHMTAAQNVAFGLSGSERMKRAREELKAVGLDGFEQRYPHQLSGGQQQRVALARALARRPRVMLLDEPFASIDGVLRRRLRGELRRLLKASNASTMLVTHDPEEALAIGDRIAIMKGGRIIEAATPQALYENPGTAEGANLFPGSQRISARCSGGLVQTAFGEFRTSARVEGAASVVVLPAGASLASGEIAEVSSLRFAGPGWIAEVIARDGERLHVATDQAVQPGQRCGVFIDPRRAKVFATDG